jgi:hypothetical protein
MGKAKQNNDFFQLSYKKGGNEGSITYWPQHDKPEDKPYCALTPVMSKWYKTQAGAEKFMSTRGYTPAPNKN